MKDPLVRFSVAIGGELLRKFDHYRESHHYPNRSEAVRGLMRSALIEDAGACGLLITDAGTTVRTAGFERYEPAVLAPVIDLDRAVQRTSAR